MIAPPRALNRISLVSGGAGSGVTLGAPGAAKGKTLLGLVPSSAMSGRSLVTFLPYFTRQAQGAASANRVQLAWD